MIYTISDSMLGQTTLETSYQQSSIILEMSECIVSI